jgi:hypothetical protein
MFQTIFFIISLVICIQGRAMGNGFLEDYLTLKELEAFCKASKRCDGKLCCEGKEVRVKGYLDYINIFHSKTYPNVVYPKFRVFDGPGITETNNPWSSYTESLEIYPVSGDIELLFDRLIKKRGFPLKTVYIKGRIRGFDAYTEKGIFRLFNLVIDAGDGVLFEKDLNQIERR